MRNMMGRKFGRKTAILLTLTILLLATALTTFGQGVGFPMRVGGDFVVSNGVGMITNNVRVLADGVEVVTFSVDTDGTNPANYLVDIPSSTAEGATITFEMDSATITGSTTFAAGDFAVLNLTAELNQIPVATDDSFATGQDTQVSGNVITGDTGNGPDSDAGGGDPLVIDSNTEPASGTLVLNSDGSFTYDPQPGFNGMVSFTYSISDGIDTSNTATVTITVSPSTAVALSGGEVVAVNRTYLPVLLLILVFATVWTLSDRRKNA